MLMLRTYPPRSHHIKQLHRCISNLTEVENTKELDSADTFGTLSHSGGNLIAIQAAEKLIEDDPDGYDKQEFDYEPRKNLYYYKYEITKYARLGSTGLRNALELFQEMKSKARLQPTIDQFSVLIYGCAKAGFTKKAFELYEEYLKYESSPSRSMVTCLINACAESPFPEYGLKRLEWLITHMKVNHTNISFNLIQYNSAIKAYGRLGRLDEAAKLIETMVQEGIYPDVKTFAMLLMGCASNQKAGCTIALRVFKRMKMYDIRPEVSIYTLLLRCIRDCGMGSPELIRKSFQELPAIATIDQRIDYKTKRTDRKSRNRKQRATDKLVWAPLLEDLGKSIKEAIQDEAQPKDIVDPNDGATKTSKREDVGLIPISLNRNNCHPPATVTNDNQNLPNLLSNDHLQLLSRIEAIQFDKLNDKSNRILLFGGIGGYLEAMLRDGCKPNTKVFTLLLELVEPSHENYIDYFKLSDTFKIERDVLFYDMLIQEVIMNRKRVRQPMKLALHFLEQMHYDNLRPTIQIYEAIARGCTSWEKANQLLSDLSRSGFTISDRLIRELFYAALSVGNLDSLNHLIELSRRRQFRPSKYLVDKLEAFRLYYCNLLLEQEKGITKDEKKSSKEITEKDGQLYDEYKKALGLWLSRVELQEEEHPWSQYDVDTKSKKDGFLGFVRHMNAMNQVKQEALKRGGNLGNISYKAAQRVTPTRGQIVANNNNKQVNEFKTSNSKELV